MLVFIDESGDPGRKVEQGSSRFFTVSLVLFEDNDAALACDQRIGLLRKELGWSEPSEFHFHRNSDRVKRAFLQAVMPYDFFYYGIVVNKDPGKLWGPGFDDKQSFYKYTCSLVFENAKGKLSDATVVIDESGNLDFKRQLAKYLRQKVNDPAEGKRIKKVKMQSSARNNLLQLADYAARSINRSMQPGKKFAGDYRKLISRREINVQVWPK